MRAVQPPPADDDEPRPDEAGRVIDLPAGALSSSRRPRTRTPRPPRPAGAADLGSALSASLADVSAAAERLADSGGVVPPAAPRASRPARTRSAPSTATPAPAAARRPRAVPRPPAWQPAPWSEVSAASDRREDAERPERSDRAHRTGPAARATDRTDRSDPPRPAPRPPATAPPDRAATPAGTAPTAIATVPLPAPQPRDPEAAPRLRGVDAPRPDVESAELVRTVPGWALAAMVVIVAVIACLAGYLLLRP